MNEGKVRQLRPGTESDRAPAVPELAILKERDRIAHELHDNVLRRLFAMGLDLQALCRVVSPYSADRVQAVIDELDAVMSDIRRTVFGLESLHATHRRRGPDRPR